MKAKAKYNRNRNTKRDPTLDVSYLLLELSLKNVQKKK
jgi:hypothetical protein